MAPQPTSTEAPPDPSKVQWDAGSPDPSQVTWDKQGPSTAQRLVGVGALGEPAAQFVSGVGATVAGAAAGLYQGTAAETEAQDKYHLSAWQSFDVGWQKMKDTFHDIQQKYTYQPRTPEGQTVSKALGIIPQAATEGLSWVGKRGIVDPTAWAEEQLGAAPETVARTERVGRDVADIAAPFALGGLGKAWGQLAESAAGAGGPSWARSAGRDIVERRSAQVGETPQPQAPPAASTFRGRDLTTQQAARTAGYTVPEGPIASFAGRTPMEEVLSRRHEPVNNQNARAALGLQGDAPVELAELEQQRTAAHAASYDQLQGDIKLGPGLGTANYSAFKQQIANSSRNLDGVAAFMERLEPGQATMLMKDVENLQKEFYKQRFSAPEMVSRMKDLRAQWDRVKHIANPDNLSPAQIRGYMTALIGRNIADTLQQTLTMYAQRAAPELVPQLERAARHIDNTFAIEDARLPNGNISPRRLMQIEDSGRTLSGPLKTMADTARHMPGLVQDLAPQAEGLLSPTNWLGRWNQMSWPQKAWAAGKYFLAYEALAQRLISTTTGAIGGVAYGAYKGAKYSRPALRRMLMGHWYNERMYPQTPPPAPRAYTPRYPPPAAVTAVSAYSEMDQGNGDNLTR